VVNIEGCPAEQFIGYTKPVSVVFGCGTVDEMEVRLNDGFLVLGNPAVESMYTCVLGRGCLDKVSGCVWPYLQTFFYMPRLQQGDRTVATMPVRIGRLAQPGRTAVWRQPLLLSELLQAAALAAAAAAPTARSIQSGCCQLHCPVNSKATMRATPQDTRFNTHQVAAAACARLQVAVPEKLCGLSMCPHRPRCAASSSW
jgi:hypothetical protein